MDEFDLKDVVRGGMVGGAVGDALGYPVEFMSYDGIVERYGPQGITQYEFDADGVAAVSDDTQMSLFTANGLLLGDVPGAYIEWLRTQNVPYSKGLESKCWIAGVKNMYARRAPGNTCMSALRDMSQGLPVKNNSKGCGGIMRVAPIALYNVAHGIAVEDTARQACEAAKLTHKHPLGWLPAGIFAAALHSQLLNAYPEPRSIAQSFKDGLDLVSKSYQVMPQDYEELNRGIELAMNLGFKGLDDLSPAQADIRKLGEGWTAEETLYIAIYCCIRYYDNPAAAIIAAVNHSGDSDSTGAVTGNYMGAIHGYSSLPGHFKRELEMIYYIRKMADDLVAGKPSR